MCLGGIIVFKLQGFENWLISLFLLSQKQIVQWHKVNITAETARKQAFTNIFHKGYTCYWSFCMTTSLKILKSANL